MSGAITPLGNLAAKLLQLPPVNVEIGTNKVIAELGAAVGLVMLFPLLLTFLLQDLQSLSISILLDILYFGMP